ncbi:hypothetical protein [Dyadobacter tibetensis]|uniref:hypothetical protein n=1 Tax=Dyadobacter tibetensis TaxID=1211851 RepID=UPI0004711A14|nr:hypothetical protein [Dyadobacter tibetensis]
MLKSIVTLLILISTLSGNSTIAYGQQKKLFSVGGPELQTMVVTHSDFETFNQIQQQSTDTEGNVLTYQGISLHDVLVRAGIPSGNDLNSQKLMSYLTIRAADGYEVLFSLPETDPVFTDQTILLILNEKEGMKWVNLVVPNDKRKSRWVKHIIGLEIGQAASE